MMAMSRSNFNRELQEVKDDVLLLGSMVEDAVMKSVKALVDNNLERSRLVRENDVYINRKRYEIELFIIMLIAKQQPAACDLRMLTTSLDISTELERIGDYAKGISNINIRSGGLGLPSILKDVYSMGQKSIDMLNRALTSYAEEDFQAAQRIIQEDDLIDECYTRLYHDAVNNFLENARNIERANYVIWAAHNLERLGDRVTNICERAIYMVTGKIPESSVMTGPLKPLPHGSQE